MAVSLSVQASPALAAPGDIAIVNLSDDEQPSDRFASSPSISADGRYVAFESDADNLGGDPTVVNVYVRDLLDGTTVLVSQNSAEERAEGDSTDPSISADGRYVAFESVAENLGDEDNDGDLNNSGDLESLDVFVRDLVAGTTVLVSRGSGAGGPGGDDASGNPSISADGRWVAFDSIADNLGGDPGYGNVYLRDWDASSPTTYVASAGANSESYGASVSDGGTRVAFESLATNLSTDENSGRNVFVWTRASADVALASRAGAVANDGGNGPSETPRMSADGRFVAFTSTATNLGTVDPNSGTDVFLRDLQAATTTLVSRAGNGDPGNGFSRDPDLSADGRFVVFTSLASNLDSPQTSGEGDLFVRDTVAGTTRQITLPAVGDQPDGGSGQATITGDGRFVAFQSRADNLGVDGEPQREDVFRLELAGAAGPAGERADERPDAPQADRDSLGRACGSLTGRPSC